MTGDETDALAMNTGAHLMIFASIVAGMAEAGTCDVHQVERVATRLAGSVRETHPVIAEFVDTFVSFLEYAKPSQ